MIREPLSPKTLLLLLPAMSREQAEQVLHFVDLLQQALWDAYADDVLDLAADGDPPELDEPALDPDDSPEF